jgi:hypothetical protein
MTIVDDRILEYLAENEAARPGTIQEEGRIRVTSTHVGRRCKKLANYGLVMNLGDAVYMITEKGEAYLSGDLDTQSLGEGNTTSTATA